MSDILGESGSSGDINLAQSPLDFQPSARDYALREWLLRDVLAAAAYKDFAAWVNSRILVDGLEIPIGQVQGFSQFTAFSASVATAESTTSTSYTDLATAGPTLSNIGNGEYLVIFSVQTLNLGANQNYVSTSVNGAAASDDNAANVPTGTYTAISFLRLVTLTNTVNTITMKYRTVTNTAFFKNRNLIALKYANL